MRSTAWGTTILGLTLGLAAGFTLGNLSHRSASERRVEDSNIQGLQSDGVENLTAIAQKNIGSETLSTAELQQAIARADNDVKNWRLQRELGMALFRYSLLEENSELLSEAVRLLERVEPAAAPQDKEFYQTLGDGLFILGRQKDLEKMPLARAAYQKALKIDLRNADLFVSIGQTYFYQKHPNPAVALKQYNQALVLKPNHEKGLEQLVSVLLELNEIAKAKSLLEKLRQVNRENRTLADFQLRLNQKQLHSTN